MCGQLLNLLDKAKILRFSRENGGERYVKHFDAWQHLIIMLYAVIKRFDSLREITDSMFPEARKLAHLGIRLMPCLFLRIERKWNAFDIGIFHSSLNNKWALSHSTTALMMRMSLRGLSSSPVFTFSIFETTFIPSVTSPKTV